MNPELKGQEQPQSTRNQRRRLRAQKEHERLKRNPGNFLVRRFTEMSLAARIAISTLAAGSLGSAGVFAYDHFINTSTSVGPSTTVMYESGIRNELASIENAARSSKTDHKTTALRLGHLAMRFVCHEISPEIACDPKTLVDKMHIQGSEEYRKTFYGRANCSATQSVNALPPAYTDVLTQDIYFDLDHLTRMPISTAWQGFIHEALHANSELKSLDTSTELTNVLSNASAVATKQRGLRGYVPRPELNNNSRDCYDTHPTFLEEAVVVDTKRRMMEKLGFPNAESAEYQRVGSNYSTYVVDRLFGGDYKSALVFHQTSQAIPFYKEIGARVYAQPGEELRAGEVYLSRTVLEGQLP